MGKKKTAFEAPQIGVRLSENPEHWSHSRYYFAVTNCKSESYGKFHKKAAPNLRQYYMMTFTLSSQRVLPTPP